MLSLSKKITVIFSLLLISLGTTSVAQQRNISDGVYTEAQAILGKDDHDANCKACHAMKFYRDIWFVQKKIDNEYNLLQSIFDSSHLSDVQSACFYFQMNRA